MSSRNRYKKSERASLLGQMWHSWKEIRSFILDIFQISWQPRRIRKNRATKNFCWCRGIFL